MLAAATISMRDVGALLRFWDLKYLENLFILAHVGVGQAACVCPFVSAVAGADSADTVVKDPATDEMEFLVQDIPSRRQRSDVVNDSDLMPRLLL